MRHIDRVLAKFHVLLSLSICLGFSSPSWARATGEPFIYEFYGADVTKWQNGDGAPKDAPLSAGALLLLDQMQRIDTELLVALYGVYQQDWFLDLMGNLVRRAEVSAVVDQKHGATGEWLPENFNYPHTPDLARVLNFRNISPDVNTTGSPRTASIMHNKFLVFDRSSVWLGSSNLSATCIGSDYNANTSLLVHSRDLAEIYAREFEQMKDGQKFSKSKLPESEGQKLTYNDGTEVEVYFSPQDNATHNGIIPFVKDCRRTLDIGMFFLTSQEIVEALLEAQGRGCRVRIILDALSARHGSSKVGELRAGGVEVRVENWGGKMHMKSAVADGHMVVMGSMNWSEAGNVTNDENTIVVRGNRHLALDVSAYFETLWSDLSFYDGMKPELIADPIAESMFSRNSCFDGMDNDYDGLVDADDPGCQAQPLRSLDQSSVHAVQ